MWTRDGDGKKLAGVDASQTLCILPLIPQAPAEPEIFMISCVLNPARIRNHVGEGAGGEYLTLRTL